VKRTLEVRKPAQADITDAVRWYEQQDKGLGAEFLRALEACFARIQRSPEAHAPVHPRVRRALLRRFPYGVFYVVEEHRISVIACLHVRRRPGAWKRRT
jgi:plasmid stabilization system protein ParE